MRVLMQSRADLYTAKGGDTVQIDETAKALRRLGISVDISLKERPDLKDYDLVHLFNITRVHETYLQLQWARQANLPVVLTPIYHPLSELETYNQIHPSAMVKLTRHFVKSFYMREQLKTLYRAVSTRRAWRSCLTQWRVGYLQQQKAVLENAAGWLVLANAEKERILKDFSIKSPPSVLRVPVGISEQFLSSQSLSSQFSLPKRFVLCVGRIEPRKNQLNLVKAMQRLSLPLVLVGAVNGNHRPYYKAVLDAAKTLKHFKHLGVLPHEQLPAVFQRAHTHALVSYTEVLPIVNFEAAVSNCQLVMSNVGYSWEYFANQAYYVDPQNVDEIRQALLQSFKHPHKDLVTMMPDFTWENTAKLTLAFYQKVLGKT